MIIKLVLIAVVFAIAVLAIVISLRPSEFRVTRSASIVAPPEVIFEQINTLSNWHAWSPWAKLDPAAKETFEGPPAGVGAIMRWAGNNQVGEGSMTIIESRPNELIRFRLDFIKPFQGTNTAEFTFKSESSQTTVTWSIFGKNNFFSKAIGLFLDCEKMVSGQFDKGLADLKLLTETAVKS